MDIQITTYPRRGTADIKALTDGGLKWLRTFTVLHVPDDRPYITVAADAVSDYSENARLVGLEVRTL